MHASWLPMDAMSMHIQQLEHGFSDPDSARLARAWLRWRADRLLPQRSDLELRDIAPILGRMALFELRGPDEVIIRLAGTTLRDIVDFELTGRNFRDITAPADWPERYRRLSTMARHPCAGFMSYRDVQPSGRIVLLEVITLPLDSDQPGKPPQLISCTSQLGRSFELPSRDQRRAIPLAVSFTFVDIGAGLPDAA